MKDQRGITLVALVVTIIILIILAGISINITLGENGIITKTKEAKQNIILAGEAEAIQLNQLYYELETGGELTDDEESTKKDEIIALLQKQVEELQKQVEQLTTENESLKQQIADLLNQIKQLQAEIADLKKQLANKDIEIEDLKKQVAEKEQTIQNLQEQLNNINSLLSQTNATADKILTGYKAYSKGQLVTGTMPSNVSTANVSNDKAWLYSDRVYFGIPYGYYPSASFGEMTGVSERYITYGSLAKTIGLTNAKLAVGQNVLGINGTYTSDANAIADNLSSGKTAYVNGQKITGNGTDVNNAYNNGYNDGVSNSKVKRVKLGSCSNSATFTVTGYEGWQNFTEENFAMMVTGLSMSGGYWNQINVYNQSASISYNSSTGVLIVKSARGNREVQVQQDANTRVQTDVICDVYLYY